MLTPLGETLRSDVPGSIRDFIIAETAPGHWLPWGKLADAVRQGGSTVSATLGVPDAWAYYGDHDDERMTFARGMSNLSAMVSQDVARVYTRAPARSASSTSAAAKASCCAGCSSSRRRRRACSSIAKTW